MATGSTAIQIVNAAYIKHNLNPVTTFDSTLEFPYNIALDIINDVIEQMNRQAGNLYFMETATPLTYQTGTAVYNIANLGTTGVNPRRIRYIRRETASYQGELTEIEYRAFLRRFSAGITNTAMPTVWSKYNGNIVFNTIPDQDYALTIYHFTDMPLVVSTTDTLLIPLSDEDVVRENCYAMLGCRIGKWDMATTMQLITAKTDSLLFHDRSDAGLPTQLPATF